MFFDDLRLSICSATLRLAFNDPDLGRLRFSLWAYLNVEGNILALFELFVTFADNSRPMHEILLPLTDYGQKSVASLC